MEKVEGYIQINGEDLVVGAGNDKIVEKDAQGYITRTKGPIVPITASAGYARGCIFIKTNDSGNGIYFNSGSHLSCLFDQILPGSSEVGNTYYVDGNRTDEYTAIGTIDSPFKTIKACLDVINVRSAALWDSQAHFDTAKYVVKVAEGTYSDDLTINSPKYLRIEMEGVVISGNITINQEQLGISSYYGKVELVGGRGNRSDKGQCGRVSGNIIFAKTAYDSLAYDAFIGIEIAGDVLYGAEAGEGHGTWVLYLENTSFSSTSKSITTNFDTGGHCLLIESSGFNEIKSTLTGVIDLYNCNNTSFRNINITPANGCKIRNCSFTGTVSIVAAKTLELDLTSMKAMYDRTPTLTGMVITPLDDFATIQVPLTSANILAMNGTPVTIVPAVTGKTIVIDEITLKMVTTATQYANGGAVEIRYTDGSGAKVTADIAAAIITAGAGTSYTINKAIVTSLVGVVSSPIVITNADAAFITGTGAGTLYIKYHLI